MFLRLRFRIRTMLMVTFTVAIALSWYQYNARQRAAEQEAITKLHALLSLDVPVLYDDATLFCGTGVTGTIRVRSPESTWIRALTQLTQTTVLDRVEEVGLWGADVEDEALPHILAFSSVRKVTLRHTNISNAAADNLRQSLPNTLVDISGEPAVMH